MRIFDIFIDNVKKCAFWRILLQNLSDSGVTALIRGLDKKVFFYKIPVMAKLQLTTLLLVLTLSLSPLYCPDCSFAGETPPASSASFSETGNQPEQPPQPEAQVQAQNPEPPKVEPRRAEPQDERLIKNHPTNPTALRAIERNIILFTERIREKFTTYLKRSGKYLELMRDILKTKKIPEDIAFLALVESGFNPNAYSVARAVGPWQFIADTAKRYGLKIDWWKDERKDPVKSTLAAAAYLKDLYKMFGSWNLAMAAYNAGEGKILKALNRSKSDDYWELVNTAHIKDETKEYVPRFIAAGLIANNPGDYGFEDLVYHAPFEYDEVVLKSPVDLDIAAWSAQTTVQTIRELNPELRRWCTPPNVKTYKLRVPAGKGDSFLENLSSIPEQKRFTIDSYEVKKRDTLKKISARTRVPVNVILELNNMNIRPLKPGEIIYLPPQEKFSLDRDDRASMNASVKKASFKKNARGKRHQRHVLVASFGKKKHYLDN
jgi:peptidoglycan lytic transglycosylase D